MVVSSNWCVLGLEQVHDAVEQSLLKEVAILRECQDKFRGMLEKVQYQYYISTVLSESDPSLMLQQIFKEQFLLRGVYSTGTSSIEELQSYAT